MEKSIAFVLVCGDDVIVAAGVCCNTVISGLLAKDSGEHLHRPFGIVSLVMQVQNVPLAHLVRAMMKNVRELFINRQHRAGGRP